MAAASGCVTVAAPLDIAEVDRVRSAVTSAVQEAVVGARRVVVDLTRCEFVDAVGHRVLDDLARTAERSGVSLRLVGASPAVVRVITVLDAVLRADVRARVVADAPAAAPAAPLVDSAP